MQLPRKPKAKPSCVWCNSYCPLQCQLLLEVQKHFIDSFVCIADAPRSMLLKPFCFAGCCLLDVSNFAWTRLTTQSNWQCMQTLPSWTVLSQQGWPVFKECSVLLAFPIAPSWSWYASSKFAVAHLLLLPSPPAKDLEMHTWMIVSVAPHDLQCTKWTGQTLSTT